MKKLVVLCYLFFCGNAYGFSDPKTWNKKKDTTIRLATDLIANREKFSSKCYKDGHGWSIGYGDFYFCDDSIKVLRKKHILLRYVSDDIVRKQVVMSNEQAKWKLKKYVIEIYDRLETKQYNGKYIMDKLDEKELIGIIDNIYTRGETNFYKSNLWNIHVKEYIKTSKINCLSIAHEFFKQSKKNNGVLARRLVELQDFTYRSCSYDVKFLMSALKQYKS